MTDNVSNSANMTMAERLAQKIKTSPLGELMDEEDIAETSKKAIDLAFFQKRELGSGYDRTVKQPLIVEMATDIFKKQIGEKMQAIVDELCEHEDFKKALMEAAAAQLPTILHNAAIGLVSDMVQGHAMNIQQDLQNKISSGFFGRVG